MTLLAFPLVTKRSTSRSRGVSVSWCSECGCAPPSSARFRADPSPTPAECGPSGPDPKGLLQESKAPPLLHGLYGHGNIDHARDEITGMTAPRRFNRMLQIEAASYRHAHVKDQAPRLQRVVARQELLSRGQCRGSQANDLTRSRSEFPAPLVVIRL